MSIAVAAICLAPSIIMFLVAAYHVYKTNSNQDNDHK